MLEPEIDRPEGAVATMPRDADRVEVAVVGGGASGTLCAIHLMASRAHDLRVSVHDPSGVLGRGLAYGTTDARHLLNVRSRHMSAFPDIPSDLVEWASRTGRETDAQAFLPRRDYGVYLRETVERLADDRLSVRAERVDRIEPIGRGAGFRLHAGDRVTQAGTVVLAYGNATPAALTVDDEPLPDAPWHLADPWDLDRLTTLGPDATVVLVGTGLTAIDTAISVLDDFPGRRIVMTSRHGLLPEAHIQQNSTAWVSPVPTGPVTADQLAELVWQQFAAARRQGVDWRPVVDGLRAPTQSLWQRLDLAERRKFVATYARFWEVRRHRMAPGVAARIERYRTEGRLTVLEGALGSVLDHGDRCEVGLPGLPDPLFADAVVNCTGPRTDIGLATDPLLRDLLDRGLLTPDPLRLGVSCTPDGEVLDVYGEPVTGLYVVGPPRKGTLWETTAVPEIRGQAAALARVLPQRCGVRG